MSGEFTRGRYNRYEQLPKRRRVPACSRMPVSLDILRSWIPSRYAYIQHHDCDGSAEVLLACKRVANSDSLLSSSNLWSFSHSYKQRRACITIAFFALHYFLHNIKVLLVKTDAFTSLAKEEEEECVSTPYFIQFCVRNITIL